MFQVLLKLKVKGNNNEEERNKTQSHEETRIKVIITIIFSLFFQIPESFQQIHEKKERPKTNNITFSKTKKKEPFIIMTNKTRSYFVPPFPPRLAPRVGTVS
jgi:hypothetical protein